MSAPNETAAEDIRNALALLYSVHGATKADCQLIVDARRRLLSAQKKIELANGPRTAMDPCQRDIL